MDDASEEAWGPIGVRRLGWAGFELICGEHSLVIDHFLDNSSMEPFVGELRGVLLPPSRPAKACAALVTHLHADHADPVALTDALAPGASVLRPERAGGEGLETIALQVAENGFAEAGLAMREMLPWERTSVGPFKITALPAVDGFGDPQLSWGVEAGGKTIVHMGDTIFHGHWWLIGMRMGTIDLALLPVNGPTVSLPHRQPPSPFPAALDPDQAAVAAELMGARMAMPMHYDTLGKEPHYIQREDPAAAFELAAAERGVAVLRIEAGEVTELR